MTDTTAFESLIAEDVRDEVGPEECVDALAITRKAKADSTRWRFQSMFGATRLIAAAVIVALFGGFLLVGVLTTPDGDQVAPGAVTDSPSPMTAEESPSGVDTFPSGAFVSVENKHLMLEFGGDGTGVKHDLTGRTTSFTYAVDDDIYTWLTSENGNGISGQPDYAWDYDGERLAFELLDEDPLAYRKWVYTENTYQRVDDPQVVVVAERDLDVGKHVRAKLGFVPVAEAGPDAYTSLLDVPRTVAAVPISRGQVITPVLLELEPAGVTTAATEPGEPVARTDILPGVELSVEEVEPGVFRVVNDGVRDLALDPATWPVAGKDGGIWLFDQQGFSRLGTDGSYAWPNGEGAQQFEVAPDGTVWTAGVQEKNRRGTLRIRSFDGETWTVRKKAADTFPAGNVPVPAFTITSDGEVWASWSDPDADATNERVATVVARFGTDGWEPLAQTIETISGTAPLFVTDGGEVWAAPLYEPILRYTDGAWQVMKTEGHLGYGEGRVDVGRDGTVWYVDRTPRLAESGDGCPEDSTCVTRYDGTDWRSWTAPDGLLDVDWAYAYPVHAAPDRSVWVIGDLYSDSKDGGVARFDASEWWYFMTGRHVWAMDIAADGTVWLVVDSDEDPFDDDGDYPGHLYVINPEAVTATE